MDVPLKDKDVVDVCDDIKVDVVAVPSHTRGSVIYFLRGGNVGGGNRHSAMFTGDTLFSGGCGAPFESGLTSVYPMRRCFVELLLFVRVADIDSIKVFPGHDYQDVMMKQEMMSVTQNNLTDDNGSISADNSIFSPDFYFTLAEKLYVSTRRRMVRLSNAPSQLETEFKSECERVENIVLN